MHQKYHMYEVKINAVDQCVGLINSPHPPASTYATAELASYCDLVRGGEQA